MHSKRNYAVNIISLIQDGGTQKGQLASSIRFSHSAIMKEYVIITLKYNGKKLIGYIYYILVYPMI